MNSAEQAVRLFAGNLPADRYAVAALSPTTVQVTCRSTRTQGVWELDSPTVERLLKELRAWRAAIGSGDHT